MTDKGSAESRARRVGRVIGIVVFAAIVVAFTAICSIEIILQAWEPRQPGQPQPGQEAQQGQHGPAAPAKPTEPPLH